MQLLSTISLLSCRRHRQLYIQATQNHQNISHSQDFTGIVNLSELLSWPRWFQRLDVGTSVIRRFGRKRLLWNLGGDMQHREMQHNFLYFARDVTCTEAPICLAFHGRDMQLLRVSMGFFLAHFRSRSHSVPSIHTKKQLHGIGQILCAASCHRFFVELLTRNSQSLLLHRAAVENTIRNDAEQIHEWIAEHDGDEHAHPRGSIGKCYETTALWVVEIIWLLDNDLSDHISAGGKNSNASQLKNPGCVFQHTSNSTCAFCVNHCRGMFHTFTPGIGLKHRIKNRVRGNTLQVVVETVFDPTKANPNQQSYRILTLLHQTCQKLQRKSDWRHE